jgi:enamine deaminase RidA (YjgF/YER057c/UK114 family)
MKSTAALSFFIAGSLLAAAQTQFLKPEGLAPGAGYTHVVVTRPGKLIFISGQVARDKEGNLVGKGDLHAQAVQVFENLKTALASAGADFKDVVKITWYIRDYKPESLATLREVREKYVNKDAPPASTLIGVASLAQPDYLLEVEAVAAIPDKPARKK